MSRDIPLLNAECAVIGSGPAGEGAAMKLAKTGRKVIVIEASPEVGGGCTHSGTIPSKVLRHSIQLLRDFRGCGLFDEALRSVRLTYPQLLDNARRVIEEQVATRQRHYDRNGVQVVHGRAIFRDDHTLEVFLAGETIARVSADQFVVATGASPWRPAEINFDHPSILDSDSVLRLPTMPASITIYGAGVIGCEYASIFSHLDMKVNLVNTHDRLLSFLDDEITDALGYQLRESGVVIRHGEKFQVLRTEPDNVVLCCESGKEIRSEVFLWANGRSGNTRDMGLEDIGVAINHRGQIEVNDRLQSSVPHIYAAGDVIGPPGLASAGYDQGRFVGWQIAEGSCAWRLISDMPSGIYTTPEISCLGPTERELTEQAVPYEVGRAHFRSIARAQITGNTVGMLKLLFHRETLEILAIHCFGEQAAEIIHIGQAVMAMEKGENSLRYFTEMTFNYPTMAEAYRVAAFNGLNRLS